MIRSPRTIALSFPPVLRTGRVWGSWRGGGLVVDGAEHLAVGVATTGVVPSLDPVEESQRQLLPGRPAVLVEQLEVLVCPSQRSPSTRREVTSSDEAHREKLGEPRSVRIEHQTPLSSSDQQEQRPAWG